ncbi:hypothetical protein CUJ83_00170 [Methanocella sp. CWC-04]|uniref:Uncharacterized protein n=1 Tax=Methanooceanicella nereidis TaxID=2052831 RepID=A0AAP2W4G6_9EURY|nr:hypothetical protein [Methanocella sp. CWC-04]MCD1293413.1 hypothetical protein [Methanocella sp. CWC-04]
MGAKKSEKKENANDKVILVQIADHFLQSLIKEDVNAFAESGLLSEVLVYKLSTVAYPLMQKSVTDIAEELEQNNNVSVLKKVGGITQAKRITFRTTDQYNAFVALFFRVLENNPGLSKSCKNEEDFERFMLLSIYEFKERLDKFAEEIAKEKTKLEYEHRLYIKRRGNPALSEIPTYADFIDERFEGILS